MGVRSGAPARKAMTKKKGCPFQIWILAQKKENGKPLTTEDFVKESARRGKTTRVGTVSKWRRGAVPRPSTIEDMERAWSAEAIRF